MSEALRLNLSRGILLETQSMFARRQLLLPGLNLLLPCEGVCLENSVNNFWEASRSLVHIIDSTFVALDLGCGVVAISLGLSCDGELGDLLGWLVAFDLLARASDVQDQRMVRRGNVEERVVTIAGAAAVEAEEADIETGGVVLGSLSAETQEKRVQRCLQSSQSTGYSLHGTPTVLALAGEAL